MHEMSLCESVLQVMEQNAAEQGYSKVKTVWLEIGGLSGVEVEAMRFGFDVVTRGSLADGAKLEIIETNGRARCIECAVTVTLNRRGDPCPGCGGFDMILEQGDELRLKELEVM